MVHKQIRNANDFLKPLNISQRKGFISSILYDITLVGDTINISFNLFDPKASNFHRYFHPIRSSTWIESIFSYFYKIETSTFETRISLGQSDFNG